MSQVSVAREGTVAVVSLVRGVTNAIGSQMVADLAEAVRGVSQDPTAGALVLTSDSDRFFSIGLDIPELIDMDRKAFAGFISDYDRLCIDLYTLGMPTVAALKGHATAGGAILALCCDHRVIASGRKVIGLNEVKLGVTVPFPADRMLRDLVGGRTASRVMEQGEYYPPEEALALGMVDEVVPQEQVTATALELATGLSAHSREAYAAIKGNRTRPVVGAIRAQLAERQREFVDLWYSEATRVNLEEAKLKF